MKIYCLGDSLTTGYGVSGSDCWVHRVAAKTGFEMINAGLNGDVTLGMAARFYRDTEPMRPDLMFLLGGGNDILNEKTDRNARKGIRKILDAAVHRSIPVILGLPFPFVPDMAERLWSPDKDYDLINAIQEDYVHWLQNMAEEHGLPVANLWDMFSAMELSQRRELSLDGIHLNAEGHRIMADFMAELLQSYNSTEGVSIINGKGTF